MFSCRHDGSTLGSIDESQGKFSPDERAVAERLVREGHRVVSQRAGSEYGKMADADVCGHPTEFKVLEGIGTAKPENRIRERLVQAKGQGTHTIIDASADPRITAADADRGLRAFLVLEARDKANGTLEGAERTGARIIGRDFDISYGQAQLQAIRHEQALSRAPWSLSEEDRSKSMPSSRTASQDSGQQGGRPASRFATTETSQEGERPDRPPGRSFEVTRNQDQETSRPRGPSK